MKDFLGNEIKPGDFIAYPVRFSSSMWINVARVSEVTGKPLAPGIGRGDKLVIKALLAKFPESWQKWEPHVKKVTLERPERTVILHPDNVPDNIKKLYEKQN